jgi:hypothetical protein
VTSRELQKRQVNPDLSRAPELKDDIKDQGIFSYEVAIRKQSILFFRDG